ncbi:hypothetical protein V3N99_13260 [Dermatophilaceae bacterium Soc4.6]
MTRRLAGLDRALTLVAGLLLLVVGAGAIAWWLGRLAVVGPVLDAGWLPTLVRTPWWPWASTAAAVVLALLGLRWLAAHLPHRVPGRVALDGSGAGGRLDADLGVAADQAAAAVAAARGVGDSSARLVRDRGQVVVELTAVLPQGGRLADGVAALEAGSRDLATALGDSCPPVRGWLRTARG